jgi:hypothetical protein
MFVFNKNNIVDKEVTNLQRSIPSLFSAQYISLFQVVVKNKGPKLPNFDITFNTIANYIYG